MPELRYLIAPEFEPHRLGHSKAVDVEDSAAHAELCDIIDHLDTLETDRFEVSGKVFGASCVAFSQLESRLGERSRKLGLLEKCTSRRKKNRDLSAPNAFERLDALTGYLGVRLYFTEAFAGRIERNEARVPKRLQVGQPPLCTGHTFGHNHEKPAVTGMRERGYNDRVAGTWEAGRV
jgi:hypothetical protein